MWRVRSAGPSETQRLAARLGKLCRGGDVLQISGDLGAGKTCFVQGLARGLEVPAGTRVTSPTFNIVLEYAGRVPLHHLDLYRLGDEGELREIGFDHYAYGGGVCAVEWMERFPSLAPPERLAIELAIDGPRARTLTVTGHGARGVELEQAWSRTRSRGESG